MIVIGVRPLEQNFVVKVRRVLTVVYYITMVVATVPVPSDGRRGQDALVTTKSL